MEIVFKLLPCAGTLANGFRHCKKEVSSKSETVSLKLERENETKQFFLFFLRLWVNKLSAHDLFPLIKSIFIRNECFLCRFASFSRANTI